MELLQLDARDVRCPDLTAVVRRFMFRKVECDAVAHIVTKKPLAGERVQHMVHEIKWEMIKQVEKNDEIHFLIKKTRGDDDERV